jgi:hypothetical protein
MSMVYDQAASGLFGLISQGRVSLDSEGGNVATVRFVYERVLDDATSVYVPILT